MSNAERFVQAFTERWAEGEPSRFVELFQPEGTLLHPGMERPIGRGEVPGYVARIKSILPDIRLETKDWASRGDSVFIEWSITATFNGQQIQWQGMDKFTLRGDRATEGVAYFDTLPLWAVIDPSMKRGDMLSAVAPAAVEATR